LLGGVFAIVLQSGIMIVFDHECKCFITCQSHSLIHAHCTKLMLNKAREVISKR
jgi:hypothetical protein